MTTDCLRDDCDEGVIDGKATSGLQSSGSYRIQGPPSAPSAAAPRVPREKARGRCLDPHALRQADGSRPWAITSLPGERAGLNT
jgi:hypothetical protein